MTTAAAVQAHIAAVRPPESLDTHFEALAALAITLADAIDSPDVDSRSLPPLVRELRSTLTALTPPEDMDAFDELAAELRSAMEHPQN